MTDALMETAKQSVESIRRKLPPDGDWVPTMIVADSDDEVTIVGVPPAGGSDLEREVLWQSVVPSLLVKVKAREVVIVMTAWFLKAKEGESLSEDERPSESPNRVECLVLTHVTRDAVALEMATIVRRPKRPPQLVWDEEPAAFDNLGGRVIEALRRGLLEA